MVVGCRKVNLAEVELTCRTPKEQSILTYLVGLGPSKQAFSSHSR